MSSATAAIAAPAEFAIPDCCNIGVIFRTLAAVNLAVLMATLLATKGLQAGLLEFAESCVLVELATLLSLFSLCALRRVARLFPLWAQRLACAIVPAGVTFLLTLALSVSELFVNAFNHLNLAECAIVAALFGSVLQHYFEMRTRAYSPALIEARLQALQARIRPHFFFNSLNAVLSLIRTEPMRAETALEDLADLFRVLMRDARDITSLAEEIKLCRKYLSIEKIRLGHRLQVQWKTVNINDRVLRRAQIPALLLQPLLENAVHYGVEPAHEPVLIQIELSRAIDRIEIVVVNPLAENERTEIVEGGNHMALDNIRERLALLYDVEAQLTTVAARGYFEVRLHFPYIKTS